MEALLERGTDVESWNDERMDELSRRMDAGFKEMREGFARVDREMKEGFARVDREMKEGFARVDREMKEGFSRVDSEMKEGFSRVDSEMKEGFAQVGDRIDRQTNTVIIGGAGFCTAIVAAAVFG